MIYIVTAKRSIGEFTSIQNKWCMSDQYIKQGVVRIAYYRRNMVPTTTINSAGRSLLARERLITAKFIIDWVSTSGVPTHSYNTYQV